MQSMLPAVWEQEHRATGNTGPELSFTRLSGAPQTCRVPDCSLHAALGEEEGEEHGGRMGHGEKDPGSWRTHHLSGSIPTILKDAPARLA